MYFSLLAENCSIVGYSIEILIVQRHVVIHYGLILVQKGS